jgi:hypothetical protein
MNEAAIHKRLVEHGESLLRAAKEFKKFTGNAAADNLLNDLDAHPHAFVLACVMGRQIKAEKAWVIPYRIADTSWHIFNARACQAIARAGERPNVKARTPSSLR